MNNLFIRDVVRKRVSGLRTDRVHDCVSQHEVADVDSGDQADETGDDVGVVHVYGLSYGLEAKQQGLCVLQRED